MLAGEFQRKLRALNKDLRIWCGDDSSRPAGLFIVQRGQGEHDNADYVEICGVDKNWVPEHVEYNANGTYHKGGWRRVLRILIQKGLVDRRHAERVFNTSLSYARKPKRPTGQKEHKVIDMYKRG
jgi:hypothetical protein